MHVITIPEMKQVVKYNVLEMNEAVMFVGQFGAGKTEGIEQACEEADALCVPILLGQYDTVDLKGTPWVRNRKGFMDTVWHPASTLPFEGNPAFPDDKDIVLFLDERTSATVPVLGICYQLVDKRRVGEHKLKPRVRIISAGNRETDKGIVTRTPMPLCNRETWFEIGVDVDSWCDWAIKKYGKAAAIFVAFLNFRKQLICTYDPAKPEKNVATPRTIEKAMRYFWSTTMPAKIKQASMAGCCGDGWAAEFWGFHDSWAQIAKLMPDILKNPRTAEVPVETSLQYAVSLAISGSLTNKTVPLYHTYLMRLPPEFAVLCWQFAVKRDAQLFQTNEFLDFSEKYKAIFK